MSIDLADGVVITIGDEEVAVRVERDAPGAVEDPVDGRSAVAGSRTDAKCPLKDAVDLPVLGQPDPFGRRNAWQSRHTEDFAGHCDDKARACR